MELSGKRLSKKLKKDDTQRCDGCKRSFKYGIWIVFDWFAIIWCIFSGIFEMKNFINDTSDYAALGFSIFCAFVVSISQINLKKDKTKRTEATEDAARIHVAQGYACWRKDEK